MGFTIQADCYLEHNMLSLKVAQFTGGVTKEVLQETAEDKEQKKIPNAEIGKQRSQKFRSQQQDQLFWGH